MHRVGETRTNSIEDCPGSCGTGPPTVSSAWPVAFATDPGIRLGTVAEHGSLMAISISAVPTAAQRLRGSVLVAPSRLLFLIEPYLGAAVDEDVFSGGEHGDCVWYPLAGTLRPAPVSRWWRLAGPGAGVVGSLELAEGGARFVPNRFWRRRGMSDWQREVTAAERNGRWLRLGTPDGDAILRMRSRTSA